MPTIIRNFAVLEILSKRQKNKLPQIWQRFLRIDSFWKKADEKRNIDQEDCQRLCKLFFRLLNYGRGRQVVIKGAKVNNLKDITVEIPRNKLVVATGISGSGKSSLAFDTLFAEGQRRFAESLSSYARQFLGRMSKPDVESIDGIPPAIAIEQKVNVKNPRSTVATTTEIYDYLRIIFARIGRTYSPISGWEVKCHSVMT